MDYKSALLNFKTSTEYQPIKDTLLAEIPSHIRWDYNKDNVDEMKHRSAMIEGYLLCLKKLNITKEII